MTDKIQTNGYCSRRESPLTPILLTALITALVVGGSVFLYQSSQLEQERNRLQAQIRDLEIKQDTYRSNSDASSDYTATSNDDQETDSTSETETSETLPPIPASWKTYNNTKLGFTFRYPSTYTLTQDKPDATGLKLSDRSSSAKANFTLLVDSDTEFSGDADILYDLTAPGGSFKLSNKKLGKGDSTNPTLTTILASSRNTGTKISGHAFDIKYTYIKNSDVDVTFKQIISSFKTK